MKKRARNISISKIFIFLVMGIVLFSSIIAILIFIRIYRDSMEESAITSSEQAVSQIENTLENYTAEMEEVMDMILGNILVGGNEMEAFLQNFVKVRSDVVSITSYDREGNLLNCWSDGLQLKSYNVEKLSYVNMDSSNENLNISIPHVESLFVDYYPWVVTISQQTADKQGNFIRIALDIRFSNIANAIDNVGIGQHGYCYITDGNGTLIYHPQQQLIYSGIKEEKKTVFEDGTYVERDAIYTVYSLNNCDWRIVGVSYVDEMITQKVFDASAILICMLTAILLASSLLGWIFSNLFSRPANELAKAMKAFEEDAEAFTFQDVKGTTEIIELSNSFGHMVVRIQKLMEQVRREEISLRKTELKALQAQINPHFLYNTLDAIAWLCEEGKNEDAEEMVTALARLFRISISKGHELISIEKEVQHAKSYLKIEKFRYKNQFVYSFDVEEACLGYLCNKITLQPIIENAIYHGVNQMPDEGEIKIKIYQSNDEVIFRIEDNGIGMTEEQCREILQKEPGDRTGIGIKNVNDRIKIYFGEFYGISIESELDEGTCVTIRMPKIKEAQYER